MDNKGIVNIAGESSGQLTDLLQFATDARRTIKPPGWNVFAKFLNKENVPSKLVAMNKYKNNPPLTTHSLKTGVKKNSPSLTTHSLKTSAVRRTVRPKKLVSTTWKTF